MAPAVAAAALLQPCSLARAAAPFRPLPCGPRRMVALRAKGPEKDAPNPFGDASSSKPSTSAAAGASASTSAKEAELERLETAIRGKPAPAALKNPPRKIPIKGMVDSEMNKVDSQYENMAEWKEWHLFPEGWDQMPLGKKLTELYLGRRGIIFWSSRAAYGGAIALLGGWILFRFVGPNIGLYQLQGELLSPTL